MHIVKTNAITLMSGDYENWGTIANLFYDLWSPLMEHEKDLISRSIEVQTYNKNDFIYRIGSTPLKIGYVLNGRVKIFRNTDDGRPKIIRIFRDHQFFGYRAYFANEKYTTNCVTMVDTKIVTLPANVIGRLVDGNKVIMRYFFKELALGLGLSDDRVVSMSQKHLRGRLAETLLFLSRSFGTDSAGWIYGKITRSDIANLANMTTSNAIRTLASFREEGIIETDGKKIKITQPDKLTFISGKE